MTDLRGIASTVIGRARRQGYVIPSEVRAELARAGLAGTGWKEVVALARESLSYRSGRYYYIDPLPSRPPPGQKKQQAIREAVRNILEQQQTGAAEKDRRREDRTDFVQPVQVIAADGREMQLLSRDL